MMIHVLLFIQKYFLILAIFGDQLARPRPNLPATNLNNARDDDVIHNFSPAQPMRRFKLRILRIIILKITLIVLPLSNDDKLRLLY